ncbi:phage holin family protein [Vulcanococcus limneticus]|uniref:phage holin family protein n=1 Tax=Vulcanococcus limneticus TaxID=2170428 RepID=UPI00398BE003
MGNSLVWLLQWPVRAAILLLITRLPIGVEMVNFPIALVSALVISLAGTLLVWPLRLILSPLRMVTTLGGLIPVGFLFEWLISILLFGFTAWLIQGFRLRNGLFSAALGALAYSVLCFIALRFLGLEVPLLRGS